MVRQLVIFIFLLWEVNQTLADTTESTESQKNKKENLTPTMAPNSKFLNPHVDDATNLQLAIAAFTNDFKNIENKGETKETLSNLSEDSLEERVDNLRAGKSLKYWKWIPLMKRVVSEDKNYKFKSA